MIRGLVDTGGRGPWCPSALMPQQRLSGLEGGTEEARGPQQDFRVGRAGGGRGPSARASVRSAPRFSRLGAEMQRRSRPPAPLCGAPSAPAPAGHSLLCTSACPAPRSAPESWSPFCGSVLRL